MSTPVRLGTALLLAAAAPSSDRHLLVDLDENDGTQLSIRMTLRVDGDRWKLYSRPGAAYQMMTWRQRVLGRLTGKLPPKGALIYGSGHAAPTGDSLVMRGNLESPFLGKRYLKASLRGDQLRGRLAWQADTNNSVGALTASPIVSDAPLRDYRAVAANARDTISALVFDAAIPNRPNVQEFFRRFAEAAGRAQDDLDMVVSFERLKPLIGISHFNFIRNPKIAATPIDSIIAGDRSIDPSRFVNLSLYGNGALAALRVSRWDRVTPYLERAFQRIDSAASKVLIIDLTGNPGGDATSLVPAAYLFRDTIQLGAVVGRRWYATHTRPPVDSEMARFPVMSSEEEAKSLLKLIYQYGGAVGRIPPRAPYFGGKVYVLVNGRTGSASEPLAHLLRASGRATLVGERTAGAMLTALPHALGDGFIITVPEADYYAAGGVRLEGRGVEPDIHAGSNDLYSVVAGEIKKTLPYAALLLLAQVHFNRREFEAAERTWTEALALAPTEANKRAIEQRIEQSRRARKG